MFGLKLIHVKKEGGGGGGGAQVTEKRISQISE